MPAGAVLLVGHAADDEVGSAVAVPVRHAKAGDLPAMIGDEQLRRAELRFPLRGEKGVGRSGVFSSSPDGYLRGSYRSATAPEPNSRRLTSFKSRCFDSPANNVGPWPASLGCTTNSYSSINPSSANASGSFTPPTNSPLPDSRLSC